VFSGPFSWGFDGENSSDRFRPVGCREGFLSKEVSVALWLLLFRCGKALEMFWSLGSFWTKLV
jgi:hypothetical protein